MSCLWWRGWVNTTLKRTFSTIRNQDIKDNPNKFPQKKKKKSQQKLKNYVNLLIQHIYYSANKMLPGLLCYSFHIVAIKIDALVS